MADQKSRSIPASKANAEINQRKDLMSNLSAIADTLSVVTKVDKATVLQFFGTKGNGFLFSRDSVLRHFFKEPEKLATSLFNDNTDLLTILAAHEMRETIDGKNFEKGAPTVIIAGVKEDPTGLTQEQIENNVHNFTYNTPGNPADEYPPIQTIEEIIRLQGSDSILIKFNVD